MMRVSTGRIALFALAGAAGGLLTWLVMNPSMSEAEEARNLGAGGGIEQVGGVINEILLLGAMLGMTIGVALIAADELRSRNVGRIALYAISGAIVGALCGMVGSVAGQIVFSTLLVPTALDGRPNPIVLVIARTLGWAIIGVAAGLCPGAVARSPLRAAQGALGGAIGGGAGGLVFDLLGTVTQGGGTSRLIGFVLIGLLTGVLVSLVEEFAKDFWVTALTGSREGRSFILAKDVSTLGRSEMADIPLFGDTTVQKVHARLAKRAGGVVLIAEPGLLVTVNQRPVTSAPLSDGDILGLGGHRLRFSTRRVTKVHPASVLPPEYRMTSVGREEPLIPVRSGYPMATMTLPSVEEAGVSIALSRLEVIAGPHLGLVFPLTPGAILGRDARCDIPLVQDTSASRQHARLIIEPTGHHWRIEDGGSTNGTWVNGQRVSEHILQSGDQIGLGQTLLRVS